MFGFLNDLSTSRELRASAADEVIPTLTVRDVRRPYEKQLAVHLILANILLLFLPFFFFAHNLVHYLHDNPTLNWTPNNASMAHTIFEGRLISLNGMNLCFVVIGPISMFLAAIISDSIKLMDVFFYLNLIGLPMALIGFILMTIITTYQSRKTGFICSS